MLTRIPEDRLQLSRLQFRDGSPASSGECQRLDAAGSGRGHDAPSSASGCVLVTADVLLDMPTRRQAFPQIFDRLVVILTIQAHLFALVLIVQYAPAYQSLAACLALWMISLAVPMACLIVARQADGALPTRAFLGAAGVLILMDLAVTALVRLPDRGGGAIGLGGDWRDHPGFRRPPPCPRLLAWRPRTVSSRRCYCRGMHYRGVGAFALLVVANAAVTRSGRGPVPESLRSGRPLAGTTGRRPAPDPRSPRREKAIEEAPPGACGRSRPR